MTNKSATIVFFGNERLATGVTTEAPVLQALLAAGYPVAAVVTANQERGKSRSSRPLEIAAVAQQHNLPLLAPAKLTAITDQLRALQPAIGILVAYGKLVPEAVIELFPHGIVNIHPSLLPLHRGPTPLESVILSGEPKTGVSLMKLAKAMDSGPVYAQSELPLSSRETKQELADTLLDIGRAMLLDTLPGILNGSVVALPQDERRAQYDQRITKSDGQINWQRPAHQLERQIRAYAGWPQSRTVLAGIEVIITSASVVSSTEAAPGTLRLNDPSGSLVIGAGSGSLRIERLKPAGKPEMTAQAFLAGRRRELEANPTVN